MTSTTAQRPKSRQFPTLPWFGPLWNMPLLLGTPPPPPSTERRQPTRASNLQRRAASFCCGDYTYRSNTRMCWWHAKGAIIVSLEAMRKNNRLSLLHKINTGHVDITIEHAIPPTKWYQNAGSPAFSSCKGRPPSLRYLHIISRFENSVSLVVYTIYLY